MEHSVCLKWTCGANCKTTLSVPFIPRPTAHYWEALVLVTSNQIVILSNLELITVYKRRTNCPWTALEAERKRANMRLRVKKGRKGTG